MWIRTSLPLLLLAALGSAAPVQAQAPSRTQSVQFARGTSSITLRGTIRGDASVDYVVAARAGQTLTVSMRTTNRSAYFNILPPRSEQAIFIGSTSGTRYSGRLTQTGDYRVRVYLMRNAARRGERADYNLTVGVEGRPGAAAPGGGAIGSGPALSPGNMAAFCRGEAASLYGTRPTYIRTGRIVREPRGGTTIDGQADRGNRGIARFRCRFDARNRFIEVAQLSRDN